MKGVRKDTVSRRAGWLGIAVLTLALGSGCPPPQKPPPVPTPQPSRSLEEIVSTIEHNAALLDQALWSGSIHVVARFRDEDDREHVYNLDGNLLYRQPRDLRVDLRPGLGNQVMQIGSNENDYWVWVEPELETMWWGRHRHVGKGCARKIVVRPDRIVSALGVGGLPGVEEGLIGPARKFGRNRDILYYLRRLPGGEYKIDREYWIDRVPPYQIRVVIFRDGMGKVSMSALLDNYQPAWEGGPMVARDVSIIWPEDGGKFTLSMDGVRGVPSDGVRAGSFDRPSPERLPRRLRHNVVQVDADCDAAEAALSGGE